MSKEIEILYHYDSKDERKVIAKGSTQSKILKNFDSYLNTSSRTVHTERIVDNHRNTDPFMLIIRAVNKLNKLDHGHDNIDTPQNREAATKAAHKGNYYATLIKDNIPKLSDEQVLPARELLRSLDNIYIHIIYDYIERTVKGGYWWRFLREEIDDRAELIAKEKAKKIAVKELDLLEYAKGEHPRIGIVRKHEDELHRDLFFKIRELSKVKVDDPLSYQAIKAYVEEQMK
jgi:hypothetical protein